MFPSNNSPSLPPWDKLALIAYLEPREGKQATLVHGGKAAEITFCKKLQSPPNQMSDVTFHWDLNRRPDPKT